MIADLAQEQAGRDVTGEAGGTPHVDAVALVAAEVGRTAMALQLLWRTAVQADVFLGVDKEVGGAL